MNTELSTYLSVCSPQPGRNIHSMHYPVVLSYFSQTSLERVLTLLTALRSSAEPRPAVVIISFSFALPLELPQAVTRYSIVIIQFF